MDPKIVMHTEASDGELAPSEYLLQGILEKKNWKFNIVSPEGLTSRLSGHSVGILSP